MDVRVCGPNLYEQSKGSVHVHAADCADLKNYGPTRRFGGETVGENEMLVKDASVYKVIEATYSDQISENVSDEQSREDVAKEYESDIWFAPCCDKLPWRTGILFECWIANDKDSFAKLLGDDRFAIAQWVMNHLPHMQPHQHMHVVAHYCDEYTDV